MRERRLRKRRAGGAAEAGGFRAITITSTIATELGQSFMTMAIAITALVISCLSFAISLRIGLINYRYKATELKRIVLSDIGMGRERATRAAIELRYLQQIAKSADKSSEFDHLELPSIEATQTSLDELYGEYIGLTDPQPLETHLAFEKRAKRMLHGIATVEASISKSRILLQGHLPQ
jgi:hypothetical protein